MGERNNGKSRPLPGTEQILPQFSLHNQRGHARTPRSAPAGDITEMLAEGLRITAGKKLSDLAGFMRRPIDVRILDPICAALTKLLSSADSPEPLGYILPPKKRGYYIIPPPVIQQIKTSNTRPSLTPSRIFRALFRDVPVANVTARMSSITIVAHSQQKYASIRLPLESDQLREQHAEAMNRLGRLVGSEFHPESPALTLGIAYGTQQELQFMQQVDLAALPHAKTTNIVTLDKMIIPVLADTNP